MNDLKEKALRSSATPPQPENWTNETFHILVACMPKSGSTLLSRLVASSPGFQRFRAVPGFLRREQELAESRLKLMRPRIEIRRKEWLSLRFNNKIKFWAGNPSLLPGWPIGTVCQNHLRYSAPAQVAIDKFGLSPVVLVRNIFDVVPSIRDHYRNESVFMPMAYVTESIARMPDEQLHAFIVYMVLPWYLNFFVSWQDREHKLLVTYEQLVADQEGTLGRVLEFAGLDKRYVAQATKDVAVKIESEFTRKNVGRHGRGDELSPGLKAKIRHMASYYPDVDFSPIGL